MVFRGSRDFCLEFVPQQNMTQRLEHSTNEKLWLTFPVLFISDRPGKRGSASSHANSTRSHAKMGRRRRQEGHARIAEETRRNHALERAPRPTVFRFRGQSRRAEGKDRCSGVEVKAPEGLGAATYARYGKIRPPLTSVSTGVRRSTHMEKAQTKEYMQDFGWGRCLGLPCTRNVSD